MRLVDVNSFYNSAETSRFEKLKINTISLHIDDADAERYKRNEDN